MCGTNKAFSHAHVLSILVSLHEDHGQLAMCGTAYIVGCCLELLWLWSEIPMFAFTWCPALGLISCVEKI
jgi:hypothetical protein